MKYLSLFSGIGGFELGIGDKAECVGFSEINKSSIQIYNKHFKHKAYGDITKINVQELPDFDLIVGGFPCQSFSIAGKRGGFEDTRGTLFFEIAKIAKIKRPRFLLLENVKGLLSHNEGNTFATIISTLDELGYDCQWQVLNSKDFGRPQKRERVFIVGHLRGTPRPKVFPILGRKNFDSPGDEIGKEDVWCWPMRTNFSSVQKNFAPTLTKGDAKDLIIYIQNDDKKPDDGKDKIQEHQNRDSFQEEALGSGLGAEIQDSLGKVECGRGFPEKEDTDIPGRLLLASVPDSREIPENQQGLLGPEIEEQQEEGQEEDERSSKGGLDDYQDLATRFRRLTTIECERLQGFPDDWTKYGIDEKGEKIEISRNQRRETLGNAVTVNVISGIIEKLIK